MKNTAIKLIILSSVLIPLLSDGAVSKSHDGSGDLIVFPYYSIFKGAVSQIKVSNNTNATKALKVRVSSFHSAGPLFNFNVYLDANSTYGFAIKQSNQSFLELISNDDDVCTLNFNQLTVTALPGFMENGQVEIIEMGTVDESFTADDCEDYANNWQTTWVQNSSAGLSSASGGLSAFIHILNVAEGTNFTYAPMVFNDFLGGDQILHTAPSVNTPDLSAGSTFSLIRNNDELIEVSWPSGHQALSSTFTKTTLSDEFTIESFQAGATEWVISFPTLEYFQGAVSTPFVFESATINYFTKFNFPGDSPDFSGLADDVGVNENSGNYQVYDNLNSYSLDFNEVTRCKNTNGDIDPPNLSSCIEAPADKLGGKLHALQIFNQTDSQVARNFSVPLIRKTLLTGSSDGSFPAEGHIAFDLRPPYSVPNTLGINIANNQAITLYGLPLFAMSMKQYFNSNSQPNMLGTFIYAEPINSTLVIED